MEVLTPERNSMKIEFYIGAGKDRDGKPIPQVESWEIHSKLQQRIADAFGGWTETAACVGEWEGVREPVYKFEVLLTDERRAEIGAVAYGDYARSVAADLRDIARQTCIAVNITASTVNFI